MSEQQFGRDYQEVDVPNENNTVSREEQYIRLLADQIEMDSVRMRLYCISNADFRGDLFDALALAAASDTWIKMRVNRTIVMEVYAKAAKKLAEQEFNENGIPEEEQAP